MKNTYKIAAILAFLIGAMSIVAGSKVLLGFEMKNYTVINWLVIYNVFFGFLSIITSILIYTKNKIIKKAIAFILASHLIVLLNINFFNENAASESINAMVFRVSVWTIISLIITSIKTEKQ